MGTRIAIISLCLVLSYTEFTNGQDMKEVIEAITAIDNRVTALVKNIDSTVSGCCKCSKSNACTTTSDAVTRNVWKLAFRGTGGIKKSVYSAYRDGTGIPATVENGCKQVGQALPCSNHYRNNDILDNWTGVSEVALILYKNNTKVKQMIFDGSGSNYMNWLEKSRLKDSSWSDMKSAGANIFSIQGDQSLLRSFFLSHVYAGCGGDVGWFVAIDKDVGSCPWEVNSAIPVLKYSKTDQRLKWTDPNVGIADYFAVFVRYFNLP